MFTLLLHVALAAQPADTPRAAEPASDVEVGPSWRYAGPSGHEEIDLAELADRILALPDARHVVWNPETRRWTVWHQVPEVVRAVARARASDRLSFTVGGAILQLTPAEIADRVRAGGPDRLLVWRPGMVSWIPAERMPEVQEALRLGLTAATGTPVPVEEPATPAIAPSELKIAPAEPVAVPAAAPTPPEPAAAPAPPVPAPAPTPPAPVVAALPPPLAVQPPPPVVPAPPRPAPPRVPPVPVAAPPVVPPVAVPAPPPVALQPPPVAQAPPPLPGPPPIPPATADLSAVPVPPSTVSRAPLVPAFDFVPPPPLPDGALPAASAPIVPGDAETPLFEPPPLPGAGADIELEEIPPTTGG